MILAVIYLGSKLPKYVSKNLEYLNSTFTEDDIFFISDSEKSLAKASKLGVKTWLAPNPEVKWEEVRGSLSHSLEFRDGFWFKTLARIFVLDAFMKSNPDSPCLQIEADVFLFPNFPLSKFRELDPDIAFPMESSQRGIASLLFLKNHKISESLVKMAFEEIKINSQVTDMTLLGQVAHSNAFKFRPLPTLPSQMLFALNHHEAIELICNPSFDYSGVFDGISVGQYLLGIDPRNSRGKLILHRYQHSHAVNPAKLWMDLDENDNLILKSEKVKVNVYNLHNHAKDLRLYNASTRRTLLLKRITSSKKGEQKEFLLRIFTGVFIDSIKRRFNRGIRRIKI